MKVKAPLVLLCLLLSISTYAQTHFQKYAISINGGITFEDTYSLSLGYHFMPCRYMGIGGRVGYWREMSENGVIKDIKSDFNGDRDTDRLSRFFVMPSIVLNTPTIINAGVLKLSIGAEGGCFINKKFSKTILSTQANGEEMEYLNRSGVASLYGEVGVNLSLGLASFQLGYSISTLELDKNFDGEGRRTVKDKPTQGMFMKTAFRF